MEFTHTINGLGVTSENSFDVLNPATGKPFAKCPDAAKEQLDLAVDAARRSFSRWRELSFDERRSYLMRFGQAFKERAEEFIPLLVQEQGKPLAAARMELAYTPLSPTIVADIKEGTRLVDEEPFGPVLPVIRFSDIEDVIRRANDTRFGLGGSVWTNDLKKGADIAARLEAGTTWVNQHSLPDPHVPFGGAKESGLGREYSVLGLKSYMEAQVVNIPAAG